MPSLHFSPNPAQEQFLRAMRPNQRHFFRAGWGTGKTTLGAFIGQRLAHLNPGVNGLVASHNYNHVSVNLIPKIIAHLKEAGTFARVNKNERVIYLTTDAKIQWGSADRPPSMDGNDVGWVIGDEVRHWPPESYIIFQSRMRDQRARYPAEVLLTTPDMGWIYDEFRDNPDLIEVVSSTQANVANLRPGYIDDQRRRLSVAQAKQFIDAEWGAMSDAAFPEFEEETHVQEGLTRGVQKVHVFMDFGYNHPAVIYATYHDICPRHATRECIHVVGEMMPNQCPTHRLVIEVKHDLRRRGWVADTVFIDPAGAGTDIQTGRRDLDLLEDVGFEVEYTTDPANRSVIASSSHVQAMLEPAQGPPRLYLDASLETGGKSDGYRGLRDALARIKSDPRRRAFKKDGWYDHAIDALRYGTVNLVPVVGGGIGVY